MDVSELKDGYSKQSINLFETVSNDFPVRSFVRSTSSNKLKTIGLLPGFLLAPGIVLAENIVEQNATNTTYELFLSTTTGMAILGLIGSAIALLLKKGGNGAQLVLGISVGYLTTRVVDVSWLVPISLSF